MCDPSHPSPKTAQSAPNDRRPSPCSRIVARLSGRFCARRSATGGAFAVGCGTWVALRRGRRIQIGPVASLMRFDAQYYSRIVENGYSYSPMHGSNVAFFPAYPLFARVFRGRLGIPSSTALLIVANGCLAGAMFVFARTGHSAATEGRRELPWRRGVALAARHFPSARGNLMAKGKKFGSRAVGIGLAPYHVFPSHALFRGTIPFRRPSRSLCD